MLSSSDLAYLIVTPSVSRLNCLNHLVDRTARALWYRNPGGIGPVPLEPAIVISTGTLAVAQPPSNLRYCGSYRLRNIQNDVCREAVFIAGSYQTRDKREAKQLGHRV